MIVTFRHSTDTICSDLCSVAAELRGVLQPLTQKPPIDPCLTEEMREDAAHYVAQLQRFSVQVQTNKSQSLSSWACISLSPSPAMFYCSIRSARVPSHPFSDAALIVHVSVRRSTSLLQNW